MSGAFYWASVSPLFVVKPSEVTIDGAAYTDVAQVRADLGLDAAEVSDPGTLGDPATSARNIFRLRTDEMQRRILALPAVLSASVVASLPNRLAVVIQERVPIFVWHATSGAWLADQTGALLASADLPNDTTAATLPHIQDLRTSETPVGLGSRLALLDLGVARLLGAVTAADLGSAAAELDVSVEDADGWVIFVPGHWRAIFGHYTPDLHKTDDIPGQVQCLAALLANREPTIGTVVLAVAPDGCGTFTDATPSPRASASPRGSTGPRDTPEPPASASPTPKPSR